MIDRIISGQPYRNGARSAQAVDASLRAAGLVRTTMSGLIWGSPANRVIGASTAPTVASGPYYVSGTTGIFGTAGAPDTLLPAPVRLHLRSTGQMLRETMSDATGHYRFDGVPYGPYIVLMYDPTGEYVADVSDPIYGLLP